MGTTPASEAPDLSLRGPSHWDPVVTHRPYDFLGAAFPVSSRAGLHSSLAALPALSLDQLPGVQDSRNSLDC